MPSSRGSLLPKPGELTSLASPALAGGFFTACLGLPCGSAGKQSTCSAGDLGLIPGLGRSPGGGNGYLLRYSGLQNSMNCVVHGVAKSQTRLSDFHLLRLLYHWRHLGSPAESDTTYQQSMNTSCVQTSPFYKDTAHTELGPTC